MQNRLNRHGSVPTLILLMCSCVLHSWARLDAVASEERFAAPSVGEGRYCLDESLLQEEVRGCLGIPYRRGGASAAGMDCSGFAKYLYSRLFGVELPHKAARQFKLSNFRDISQESLQMGDLVFFKNKNLINHVGIYLSDKRFAHSVGGKGVVISSLENPYWESLFAGSRRLMGIEANESGSLVQAHTVADVNFDELSSLQIRFAMLLPNERPWLGFAGEPLWTTFRENRADPWEDLPLSFEIGYQGCFAQDLVKIRLSAFYERALLEEGVTAFSSTFRGEDSPFLTPYPRTVFQRGWSLAGEIGLFQGFWISPFLTLAERGVTVDDGGDALSILGVKAFLTPPATSYDLSLALDYGDRGESAPNALNATGSSNDLRMSFRFRYRIKDLTRVSLVGQHAFGDPLVAPQDSSARATAGGDLFFLFDLSY